MNKTYTEADIVEGFKFVGNSSRHPDETIYTVRFDGKQLKLDYRNGNIGDVRTMTHGSHDIFTSLNSGRYLEVNDEPSYDTF